MGGSVLNASKRKLVFKNNRVTEMQSSKRVVCGKMEGKHIRSMSFDRKNSIPQELSGKIKANRTVYKKSSCAVLLGIQMVLFLVIVNYFIDSIEGFELEQRSHRRDKSMQWREPKKMFGGYRITPRFCTPSRPTRRHKTDERRGPAICMFNHECSQRNGEVVGACMDGFLFGACCQLFGTPGVMKDNVESGVVMMASNDAAIKKPDGLVSSHLGEDIVIGDKNKVPAVGNVVNGGSNMYIIRTTEKDSNTYSKSPDDETNEQVIGVSQNFEKNPSTLAVSLNHLASSTDKYHDHDLTSSGLAQIANTLLHEAPETADILPENIDTLSAGLFSHSTISHEEADTILLNRNGSVVVDVSRPSDFLNNEENVQVSTMQTKPSMATQFYSKIPSTTPSTTIFTHKPVYQKPVFRPKPTKQPPFTQDKFVLVQTVNKPQQNKPQTGVTASDSIPEMASIESIMNMLNETHPSTITYDHTNSILVDSSHGKITTATFDKTTLSPQQYSSGYATYDDAFEATSESYSTSGHYITTGANHKKTTYRPPSTSYVYHPTVTRRPTYSSSTDKYSNNYGSTSNYYTKKPAYPQDTTNDDDESSTNSNVISSTLSYDDYWGSSQNTYSSTPGNRKPPSTSYIYSATPTKRPVSNVHDVVGPNYEVLSGSPDTFSSVTPTVIVLSSLDSPNYNSQTPKPIKYPVRQPVETEENFVEVPLEPPHKKPVHLVTINNVISSTNNIHLGHQQPLTPSSEKPAPTVLITPKPSTVTSPGVSYFHSTKPATHDYSDEDKTTASPLTTNKAPSTSYVFSSTISRRPTTSATPTNVQPSNRPSRPRPKPTQAPYDPDTTMKIDFHTSPDEFINFPPVRNPNLNATGSNPAAFNNSVTLDTVGDAILQEVEFTTPAFLQEDEDLDDKMSLFVNKIVGSLQGTFQELHDIVILDKTPNTTITQQGGIAKPLSDTTTKKPSATTTKKPGGNTTKKPVRVSTTSTKKPPAKVSTTTKKPASSNAASTSSTTKKPTKVTSTTKKPRPSRPKTTTTTPATTIVVTEPVVDEVDYTTETPTGDFKHLCGVRPMVKTGRIVGGKGASFGSWPWQVLVRESTWLGLFTKNKCGGVLITNRYVTTAAHCQPGFLASLVAVFGEFDISGELESKRSITKNVRRVIVHRQYDAATFENDLALLELDSPVTYDTHIVPICMPPDDADFRGRVATVTGWGRLKYGGGVPSVLQEVQVPVIENSVCQEMFQTAGHSKVILNSFLCAGYANGQKDSCEGDSGGPLTLQRPDGRWELVGTVSHGIKCAAPYLPGVYMRTTFYKPWLKSITGVH